MTSRTLVEAVGEGRTKRWTRAAIWSGGMDGFTRRGLVNAVDYEVLGLASDLRHYFFELSVNQLMGCLSFDADSLLESMWTTVFVSERSWFNV